MQCNRDESGCNPEQTQCNILLALVTKQHPTEDDHYREINWNWEIASEPPFAIKTVPDVERVMAVISEQVRVGDSVCRNDCSEKSETDNCDVPFLAHESYHSSEAREDVGTTEDCKK